MIEKPAEWMTTKEVAEALGVSASKARSVIREEKLTVFTVGNRWKIFREDVEALVKKTRERGGL